MRLAPALRAQSSCRSLQRTLDTLERNSAYRNLNGNLQSARRLAEDIQGWESQYVRGGCQRDPDSRTCRNLGRQIIAARVA